jgi:hypothetical protein
MEEPDLVQGPGFPNELPGGAAGRPLESRQIGRFGRVLARSMPFPQQLGVRHVQLCVLDRLPKVDVLPHLMNTEGAMDVSQSLAQWWASRPSATI